MNHTNGTPEMTFATLFVARHGEVDESFRRSVYGRLDVPLSERGLEQSDRMAAHFASLPLAFVVTSGLQRAEAAAARVRANRPDSGLERLDDERFLELDRGEWAGRTIDQVRAEDPKGFRAWTEQRGAVRAPGGEAPSDVAARTRPAYDHWAARAAEAGLPGLVVAHLWVVRSAVCAALGVPMERSGDLALEPGGIVELRWPVQPGGTPELVRFGI